MRQIRIDAKESLGACWARHRILTELYQDEDYVLQIDSHSRFVEGWDNRCIAMLDACPSEQCCRHHPNTTPPQRCPPLPPGVRDALTGRGAPGPEQPAKSNTTYLLASTDPAATNRELIDGSYRALNLCAEPFNLGRPLTLLPDYSNALTGQGKNHLGVWRLSQPA